MRFHIYLAGPKDANSAIFVFFAGEKMPEIRAVDVMPFKNTVKFESTGGGWQLQPCSGTLSYSVSLCFCMN